MAQRQVVLVGLMGAGKSTIGAIVARRCGRVLVDADGAIIEATGRSVRELWEDGGEESYRTLESNVVLDALAADVPSVIAAPGGVVLDPGVREALSGHVVVWLQADPDLLAGRVRVGDHRPLLGDDPAAVLAAMAMDRDHLYRGVADAIVDVGELGRGAAADAVLLAVAAAGLPG